MTAALHYEWVRISTVRSTRILLVVLLVVSAGLGWLVAVPHYLAYDETGNPIGPAVVNWWKAFGMPLSLTAVLTSVVAAQAIGQEYRFGVIRLTLTAFPRRPQILAAKLIVVAGACVVFTLVSYLGSLLALTIRGYPTPPAAAPEAQDLYLLKGVVLVLLWGLSSFALAGIVRQTAVGIVVPVVSGARGPSAGQVIGETAAGRGAPLFLLGRDFRLEEEPGAGLVYAGLKARCPGLSLALRGAHQVENAALALAALELLETGRGLDCQVAREGLLQVCWPGRLEYFPGLTWRGRKRDVLLDGAHNPAGVESLLAALGADFADRRLIVVWASMADKDFAACLAAMAGHCQRIVLTRPESLRSATPEQLRLALPEALRERAVAAPGVEEALSLAYGLAGAGELICVAGSLYLVGKARALLAGELAGD